MQIYVINGYPESGKDQFVHFMVKEASDTKEISICNISMIDHIKFLAADLGWDGTKTPENRRFLHQLKTMTSKWQDYSFQRVLQQIEAWKSYESNAVVFIHSREPEDIIRLVETLGAKTILINRPTSRVEQSNDADNNVEDYDYDFIIQNDSTLEEFRWQAEWFFDNIIYSKFLQNKKN